MSAGEHLIPDAKQLLELPTEQRVEAALRDRWIGYPRAHEALERLADLVNHPATLRMPNLLLVGDSGNGKSTILERFSSQHQVQEREDGSPYCPVVSVEMPSEPNEGRFWSEVLFALCIAHRDKASAQQKKNQAVEVLRYVGCRALVIDEIHNILFGHFRAQRHFLGVIKNLSNELKIPIVAAGTPEAVSALQTDPQLGRRFEVFSLPTWDLDRSFLQLLASFERVLSLAYPSNLPSRDLATKLHGMSDGVIGELNRVLKRATVVAVRRGEERISLDTLNNLNWVRLADHRKADAM